MKRFTILAVWCVVALLAVRPGVSQALEKKLPLPGPVGVIKGVLALIPDGPELALEFLEGLAKGEQFPVQAKANLKLPEGCLLLQTVTLPGTVVAEKLEASWRGDNYGKFSIPCEYRYEVDLKKLGPNELTFLAQNNVLKVKLPSVQMRKVVLDLENYGVLEKRNPWLRSKASWMEMRDQALREARPIAELEGYARLEEAGAISRANVQVLLQGLFRKTQPNLIAVVE